MSSDPPSREPLSVSTTQNTEPTVSSRSTVKFSKDTDASKSRIGGGGGGSSSGGMSFSVLSSGMPSSIIAEELIMRGARKKPVAGQTMEIFFNSITHLHLCSCRLLGDVAAVTLCKNLRVLYVYENRLTSLRGLGGLDRLTHLYAQENRIESLHDFEAPPNLQQLHLSGNRLAIVGGLETCTSLTELHIGSQHPPAPSTPAAGTNEEAEDGSAELVALAEQPKEEGSANEEEKAKKGGVASPAPLSFEPASLMAIAPTLQKLTAPHSGLDDDCVEPFVVLQSLTSLDVRHNELESLGRLQQLLLRLPNLKSLSIGGNALCSAPKLRERLIVASAAIEEIEGKAVRPNERAFVQGLAMRQSSAGGSRGRGAPRAAGPTPSNRGRPQQLGVSIPSAQSFDLGRGHALVGEPPAGYFEEQGAPVSFALQSGVRRPWSRNPHAA
jgi:hypothetical protein